MKKGLIIAFVGTDGSGKSTIINDIRPWLENIHPQGVHYEHLRPNWLPRLRALKGASESELTQTIDDPHKEVASGSMVSIVRLVYYVTDYILGYWFKMRRLAKRDGKFCLFDRYFYDIIIDPRRMRISLPEKMMSMAGFIVPRPDLVLCLGTDPDVIYQRKPETSLKEVTRQVARLRELCKRMEVAVWIDTGVAREDSVSQVMQAVEDALREHNR